MTKKVIVIDEEYRLALGADNITIERLVTIDPTNSPKYKEGDSSELYTEWKSIGKFFSTIPKALTYMLEAKLRMGDDVPETLAEVVHDIAEFKRHIDSLLSAEVTL